MKDQFQAIGESIEETKLVPTILNGLPDSWDSFASSIYGRTKIQSLINYGPHVLKRNLG